VNVSEGFNSFQFKDYLMSYYQVDSCSPYSFILEVDIYRELGFKGMERCANATRIAE
jgi:hypothetical protein